MNDPNPAHPQIPPPPVQYASPGAIAPSPILLRLGGALGIGACAVGLLIMLGACFGFSAALKMSYIPALLGVVGFVFAVVGAVLEKHRITEDTHVLAALFVSCLGIIGGIVEIAAWKGWGYMHK